MTTGITAIQSAATQATAAREPRPPVNLRSILLGFLGVLFICGLTAYNDYVVANTFMVGNYLPIGLLLFFLVVVLLINTPLLRLAPRLALSRGELGVALCMMLVSCALPSSGVMRFLPTQLVGIWYHAGNNADHANTLKTVNPPDWLFPSFERTTPQGRATEPVVQQYIQRIPLEQDTFLAHFMAVPWRKWLIPATMWGIFVGLMFLGMLCLSVIFRRQWVENERLPYPLAGVYLSIIEEPAAGKALNPLFGSRLFWIASGGVFAVHGINALNKYFPKLFPLIPLRYAFWSILADPPLSYTDWGFKSAGIYFCMVGIVYFLQSNVALSLWLSYIAVQVTRMILGSYQAELTGGMQSDQNLGAVLTFAVTILFVARGQLALVLKQMFRRPAADEAQGRYLPYFLAGWGLFFCATGMVAWLMACGTTFMGALVPVLMGGTMFLVIARVVAETGLMFLQLGTSLHRPWVIAAQGLPASLGAKTTAATMFFNGLLQGTFGDLRESISGFLPQALRVSDGAAYEGEKTARRVLPFTLCLLGALGLGYVVAGGSMLYTEYSYSITQDRRQSTVNAFAIDSAVPNGSLNTTKDYLSQNGPSESHNHWTHLGLGVGITAVLGMMRLRFASWPLHPVGYLVAYTYPMQVIWFSIFVGWLVKVMIVRFGGASMYRSVKPLFMGLIIGEVGAAAFWLVVSLILNMLGLQYTAINLLPG